MERWLRFGLLLFFLAFVLGCQNVSLPSQGVLPPGEPDAGSGPTSQGGGIIPASTPPSGGTTDPSEAVATHPPSASPTGVIQLRTGQNLTPGA